jgi:hypothetical protein
LTPKGRKMREKMFALAIVVGIVTTIVVADLMVDAVTPVKSLAFTYRPIVNICTVIIFALIYWWKR